MVIITQPLRLFTVWPRSELFVLRIRRMFICDVKEMRCCINFYIMYMVSNSSSCSLHVTNELPHRCKRHKNLPPITSLCFVTTEEMWQCRNHKHAWMSAWRQKDRRHFVDILVIISLWQTVPVQPLLTIPRWPLPGFSRWKEFKLGVINLFWLVSGGKPNIIKGNQLM